VDRLHPPQRPTRIVEPGTHRHDDRRHGRRNRGEEQVRRPQPWGPAGRGGGSRKTFPAARDRPPEWPFGRRVSMDWMIVAARRVRQPEASMAKTVPRFTLAP
jgi:hypothetical protein